MSYRDMGVSPSLFVEKKRQSIDGSIGDTDSNASPVTVYRTAPCSPAKSPDKSPIHMGRPPHSMKENDRSPGISKTNLLSSSKPDIKSSNHRAPSPLVIIPEIIVTPVVDVISEDRAVSLWVAIEVVAKLAAPASVDAFLMERPLDQQLCIGKRRRFEGQDGWYGCLYNFHTQFVPCPGTYIEEIIENETPPALATESSVLYLVKVLIQPRPRMQRGRAFSRSHTSDDLIDDLELHLGNITRDYLVVRFSYNHTGFPNQSASQPQNGVRITTSLNTVATAVIRIGDVESEWSRKVSEDADPRSSFFDIVKGHGWDEDLVVYAIQRIGYGIVTFPRASMSPARSPTKSTTIHMVDRTDVVCQDERQERETEMDTEAEAEEEDEDGEEGEEEEEDEEEEEEIRLSPISPTRLKMASICPLRRVRAANAVNLGTGLSTDGSATTSLPSPTASSKSPTKRTGPPSSRLSSPDTKAIRRRRSWIFW
ncbi:hypothetical protein CFIMG_005051RA [Ceratocystis fimbriata CBS 114723]|uniref:Uncharacterized protein n=1 Tax=Ceratocystis fimbriata CBS 114723 TaxID=1035309 RepID=A0A2C5X557_9PEZI|nr:hypothetical protein CFIMG_005051RA [Ceratocystis fimbriata CBS 114723]